MTQSEQELLELAKQVIELNDKNLGSIMLTGSLMLAVRGLNKAREAGDIDILCSMLTAYELGHPVMPAGFKEVGIDGMKSEVNAIQFKNEDGIKVEFMHSEEPRDLVDGVYCAQVNGMLYAKVLYSSRDKNEESRKKHVADVLYFLEHNDATYTPKLTKQNSADDLPF